MRYRIAVGLVLSSLLSSFLAFAQYRPNGRDRGMDDPFGSFSMLEVAVREMNGQAAAGAVVEVHDASSGALAGSGVTGVGGRLELPNLPRGTYEIVAYRGTTQARGRIDYQGGNDSLLLRIPGSSEPAGNGPTVSVAQMRVPPKAQKELLKARERMQQNKPADARNEVEKALKLCPEFAEAHAFLGALDLIEQQSNEAVKELEMAVRLDGSSLMSFVALGAAYNALQQYDDAQRALQSALRLAPNSWQAHLELGRAYLGKNDFAAALRSAEEAIPLTPAAFTQPHLLRAQALMGLKEYDEAIGEYEHYLRSQPQGPEAAQVRQALNQVKNLAGGNH